MKNLLEKIYILFFTYLLRVFPIKSNKIMFWNFSGKGYGCNSKYICEYIINNNLCYELLWVVEKDGLYYFPDQVKYVKKYSLRYFYHLATSKVFIDNQHKMDTFRKRKKQYFIKTWHATLGLKKIGLDNPLTDEIYKRVLDMNNNVTDLMISNCDFIDKKFRRVFSYTGEMLQCGFPRNDILIQNNQKKKEKIRNKLGLKDNVKILLYAPTFREDLSIECYNINFSEVIKLIEEQTNEEWKVIVKLHPHLSETTLEFKSEKITDISKYDDIQELLLISDILITDYSNIMFEFGLMDKLCILYAIDYEEYRKERDLYFLFDELPFPAAFSNEDLLKIIINYNFDKYIYDLHEFYGKIGFVENGNASELLLNKIKALK